MNEHLFSFLLFTLVAILLFIWDNHKIKHGGYEYPTYEDRLFTGEWRWIYNWAWITVGMAIHEFTYFICL